MDWLLHPRRRALRRRARRRPGWSCGRCAGWTGGPRARQASARSPARPRARASRWCAPASRSATSTCRWSARCSRTAGDQVIGAGRAARDQARDSGSSVRKASILFGLAVCLVPTLPLLLIYGPRAGRRGRDTASAARAAARPRGRPGPRPAAGRSARSRTCPTTGCARSARPACGDRVLADAELARDAGSAGPRRRGGRAPRWTSSRSADSAASIGGRANASRATPRRGDAEGRLGEHALERRRGSWPGPASGR